jgi:hypothetical protein
MQQSLIAVLALVVAFGERALPVAERLSGGLPPTAGASVGRDTSGEPPPWEVEDRLFAHDQVQFWGFGGDVALDGDTALVGAGGADVAGETDRGATYVFVRQGEEWVEQAQLLAFDGAEADRFGSSVSLSGDTAVVGAPFATVDGETFQGAAYVFQFLGGGWLPREKLVASDGEEQDRLGWSVAIDGDTIVAGAVFVDVNGNQSQGAAYVFTRQDGLWTEAGKLFDPEGQPGDLFGGATALQGDTALIGADSANIEGDPNRGAAYVYRRIGSAWVLEQELLASDGGNPDQFGFSVALEGDVALIGAWQKPIEGSVAQGAAYVFRRSGTSWSEEQRLTASDGHDFSFFGWSAALDDHLALIGGRHDFPEENQQGVVYEYRYREGAWEEIQRFAAPIGHGIDGFGQSIALTGERVLISNPSNFLVQPPGGTAWIFRRPVLFEDGFESGDVSAWTQVVQ